MIISLPLSFDVKWINVEEQSVFFVINPHSRGEKTGKLWNKSYLPKLNEHLDHSFDFKIADGIGTGRETALNAIRDGYNRLVAIGGEGTVNEVVNAIYESNKSVDLGFIRSGTVNDYLQVLNWPTDIIEQIELINTGESVSTPLSLVKGDVNRVALNIADAGVAALVADMASVERRLKWIRSKFRYDLLALLAIKKWKNVPTTITADEREIKGDLSLLMAGFSTQIGGYKALPHADRLGSKIAYAVGMGFSKLRMIRLMKVIEKGKHTEEIEGIYLGKANQIKIEADRDLLFEVDGEPFSYNSSSVTIESVPDAINIIQPKIKSQSS